MNNFIKQLLIFVVPLLVVAILSEALLRKIPNDYRFKKEYLDKNSNRIEVLVLGSSYSFYGINPEYLSGSNSFNASHISQQLMYDYAILKKYDGRWDSLKYIVLPVSYFTSYGNLEEGEDAWRIKNYIIYYGFDFSDKLKYHSEVLSNKLMVNVERLYSYYIKWNSNISCSNLGWGLHFESKNKLNLEVTGKTAAKRHIVKTDKYFNKNINFLRKIIEFAKEKNVEVVLLTAPVFHTYSENLDKDKLKRAIATFVKIDEEYDNVSYTSMLNDTSFKESDFYDADHLNEIGAKKLTLKIDSIMDKIKQQRNLKRNPG